MYRNRIIPVLLLRNESLVKTTNFRNFVYVGDPCNTVRIFNELEVDELVFLDILASPMKVEPNFKILSDISNECFMPLAYGGGICNLEQAIKIFDIGFEKIILNKKVLENPSLIDTLAGRFGSQAVTISIDVKKDFFGNKKVHTLGGNKNTKLNPKDWAVEVENRGAGEILLTSINHEGTWAGFDFELIENVSSSVNIPVVAHGGAGTLDDISQLFIQTKASAAALGSMVVYQKKGMGILVNFPNDYSK